MKVEFFSAGESVLQAGARGSISEKQAAHYLGLSVKTLQAWRFQSRGPRYLKLGRAVRYRQVDLDAFVSDHTITPAA